MVESAGHGTGVLPTDKIAGLPIPRLTGPEQVAIANVLGALDDKIELNRRTCRTLKATVRALYKDWFVEFGPVRAKSNSLEPYLTAEIWTLFPNEFDRLGQPIGWRRSTLAAEIAGSGGLIQTGPFGSQLHASEYSQNGTPVVMPKDLVARRVSVDSIARIPDERTVPLARHRLVPGDIVFSRRGDVGRFAIAGERERGWLCGTGCLLVRPGVKWRSLAFLVEALDDVSTQEWIVRHAIGATMPNLNTGILGDVPMLMPSEELLEIFQQVCGAFQIRAEALSVESESLATLRDALMPKLISGEVRINGAERFIEEATA
jgi:type I restriction enzyme S subunit